MENPMAFAYTYMYINTRYIYIYIYIYVGAHENVMQYKWMLLPKPASSSVDKLRRSEIAYKWMLLSKPASSSVDKLRRSEIVALERKTGYEYPYLLLLQDASWSATWSAESRRTTAVSIGALVATEPAVLEG